MWSWCPALARREEGWIRLGWWHHSRTRRWMDEFLGFGVGLFQNSFLGSIVSLALPILVLFVQNTSLYTVLVVATEYCDIWLYFYLGSLFFLAAMTCVNSKFSTFQIELVILSHEHLLRYLVLFNHVSEASIKILIDILTYWYNNYVVELIMLCPIYVHKWWQASGVPWNQYMFIQ
jgi:hypothetical protein